MLSSIISVKSLTSLWSYYFSRELDRFLTHPVPKTRDTPLWEGTFLRRSARLLAEPVRLLTEYLSLESRRFTIPMYIGGWKDYNTTSTKPKKPWKGEIIVYINVTPLGLLASLIIFYNPGTPLGLFVPNSLEDGVLTSYYTLLSNPNVIPFFGIPKVYNPDVYRGMKWL